MKEARTKCRSIASLLTDAPNPNSKGVLMFKKRRQRAKKYTLTCFGKAEGDRGGDSEGETGGETEEEGGSSIQSGSEVDEAGFSASFDPTWDAGYLDLLEKRSSACPSATPTAPATPTANHSSRLDAPAYQWAGPATFVHQSPGSEVSALERSANQSSSLEHCSTKQPIDNQMPPPAAPLTNGGSVAVSRASVVLSAPSRMPLSSQTGRHGSPNPSPKPSLAPDPESLNAGFSPSQNVLNRTARPFTPGAAPSRPTVTSVMFRPPQPKPAVAVSMVTLQPTHHASDAKRAVSSASLYIPSRNNNSSSPPPSVNAPPSAFPQPASLPFAPFPHPPLHPPQPAASPSTPFSPRAPQSTVFPSPSQPFCPPPPQPLSSHPAPPPPTSASPLSPPHASDVSLHMQPFPTPPPATHPSSPSVHPYITPTGAVPSSPRAAMATASPLQPAADAVAAREHRIAVPAARTGILSDARRRSNKKPMFSAVQMQDVSPNPDLMSMVQNMDGHVGRAPASEPGAAPCGETGHESGPEEDWLRLGAEACNFMQAQRGPRPPPVAPKPQSPQAPPLAGKGGQLFARRQNRMDRYVVERAPSAAAAPCSPAHTREPSPTPSLPATWKYSSNIRAPPPISYNPLLSPSCPPQAQKKPQAAGSKVQKPTQSVEAMSRQPYQLNSSLFSYAGGAPQNAPPYQRGTGGGPQKTARVCEIRRFSTPPPASTGPALQVLAPRSATSLGERLSGSGVTAPPATAFPAPRPQPLQAHWASSPLSPPAPPAPTAPLPQLPSFSSPAPDPAQPPSFAPLQGSCSVQTSKPFKSAPDLSPQRPGGSPGIRVPRPRFSTSNLGLQPSVWRPGSTLL